METQNKTKKLVSVALMAALSITLVYLIRFPIFPAAPYLEYDPGDVPILICAMVFGPIWGFMVTVVVSAVQAMTVSASSGPIGCIMHIFATGSAAIVAGLIYQRKKSMLGAGIALVSAMVVATALMLPLNLIFSPMFGIPLDAVKSMLLPVILPFNLIRYALNATLTFALFRVLERIVFKSQKI